MINRYEILLAEAKAEYPRLTIRPRKSSWLQHVFNILGLFTKQDYSSFSTTIFSTIYTEDDWEERSPDRKYQLLRHELVHVDQAHRFPLGRRLWFINHLLFAICYLLVLPVKWTMRAKFEREGYFQTLLVEWELYGTISEERMESNARWLAETFGGPAYAFMGSKKRTYRWAMEIQRRINAGEFNDDLRRIEEGHESQIPTSPASA